MASEPPKKLRWADIQDEDEELPAPIVISKHGIKVQKPYVPPHQRPDKNSKRVESKRDASQM